MTGYHGITRDITREHDAQAELHASEARYRSLVGLAADWYWETDAEYRLTHVHVPSEAQRERNPGDVLGRRPWELDYENRADRKWDALRTAVEARQPVREFEVIARDRQGRLRNILVSGHPVFDAEGRFTGYRGISRDVTERRRAEQLRALEHGIAHCLAGAGDPALALQEVMRFCCEAHAMDCARYFESDERAGVMRYAAAWSADKEIGRQFLEQSSQTEFRKGEGGIGRAWQSGEPVWVSGIGQDPAFRNSAAAAGIGLRCALILPVVYEGRTAGVMALFSRLARGSDELVLQSGRVIGSQLGQYLGRARNQAELRRNEARFRSLTELSSDWYWEQDAELRFVRFSGGDLLGKWGVSQDSNLGLRRWELPGVVPVSGSWDEHRAMVEARQPFRDFKYQRVREDGGLVYVSVSGEPLFDPQGRFAGYQGIATDITGRIAQEQALRDGNARLQTQVWRQERIAHYGQFALARRSGDELVAEALRLLSEQADVAAFFEEMEGGQIMLRAARGEGTALSVGQVAPLEPGSAAQQVLAGGQALRVPESYLKSSPADRPWSGWMRNMGSGAFVPVSHNGRAHGMLAIFSPEADAISDGKLRFAASIGHVLSTALQRDQAESRLAFLAQFDPLTGLPNRSLLEDRLAQTIAQARRKQRHAGALFIDLDRFKLVNDTLGHQAGDLLLREAGRRLERCLRAGDTVGRISGDEFVAVLGDLARADDAGVVAQKILDELAKPFDLAGSEAFVTASIGIAICPGDGDSADVLLRNADMAMYKAKKAARSSYRFFTARMNERTVARLQLATDLRRAIERREFALHYQSKIDLATGALAGMEALLRWNHPQRGLVSPAEFIPSLEESGLILPVGEWVIDEACAQMRRWQLAGLRALPVAVNLSVKQFRRSDLDGVIQRALAAAGLPAALLELEITESSLADDPEEAIRILKSLHAAGLKISVDDFGTGYSSLSYLTRLPLSTLKIDRSFVRDAGERPEAAAIVRAIIDMAHNLKFTVVAEGVETQWQEQFLRLYRCDQAQGYLFGKPLPPQEMAQLLAQTDAAAAARTP